MYTDLSLQAENVLQVELDMPNRTTRDYEGPSVAPRVQAALDAALQDEDDLDLEIQWVLDELNRIKLETEGPVRWATFAVLTLTLQTISSIS